jgi:hypothetical protein
VVTTTVTSTTEPAKHKDPCKAEHKPRWCDDNDKHHGKDKDTVTHDDDNGEYTQVKDVPVGAVKTGDGSSL